MGLAMPLIPKGVLYQNANEAPWELKMIDRKTRDKEIASFIGR
jgi:hypothetical protein